MEDEVFVFKLLLFIQNKAYCYFKPKFYSKLIDKL